MTLTRAVVFGVNLVLLLLGIMADSGGMIVPAMIALGLTIQSQK